MRPRFHIALMHALAMCALLPSLGTAAPPTAHELPIQGVARDAEGVLIPSGDVGVRVYTDSLGGTPVYDSASEFMGAIAQGIFDIVVGRATPLVLDHEQRYFLELDVDGVEVLGDAVGERWRFYPGGGIHARPDLEMRLDVLEAVFGLIPPGPGARPAAARGSAPMQATGSAASIHPMLGLGRAAGQGLNASTEGNLLAQPVGRHVIGALQIELGPYYLFAPTPPPAIRTIKDVPGDQGRAVRIRWRRDLRERPFDPGDPDPLIASYTIYRRVEPGQAAAQRREPGVLRAASEAELLALPPGDWDVLTTIPATLDTSYQTVVATLCDSTTNGICWSTFFVRAITNQVGTFYSSVMDSGYSVDNLAPGIPQGLALLQITEGTQLTWQPSPEPDFQYFRIYRGLDPEFVPDETYLVQATTETAWIDPESGSFTYKLTAVDSNGNESEPAVAAISVSVEYQAPGVLAFAAARPNPFRGSLSLVIEVPESGGRLNLSVYDIAGRRVRTLVNDVLQAGQHAFTWDGRSEDGVGLAAGVYIARLEANGRAITRRVTLLP